MSKIIFVGALLLFSFSSCSRYPKDVEKALQLAGDHRPELEKVLSHYRQHPQDSLKLRAAEFLIAGMPGKYSEDNKPTEIYQPLFDEWAVMYEHRDKIVDKSKTFDSLVNKYRVASAIKRLYDIEFIKADYLINNIERSFEVWTSTPWGKDVSFDVFCEEILPYRIGTEPLEDWRDKVLVKYKSAFDSLRTEGVDAVTACATMIDVMNRYFYPPIDNLRLPQPSFSMIDKFRTGGCPEQLALATFTMRALGIPVTMDETPQWPHRSLGHGWNTVRDKNGNHIVFYFMETKPGEEHMPGYKKAKVFRKMYGRQHGTLISCNPSEQIPEYFKNPFISDISSESFSATDVSFSGKQMKGESDYVYLSVFNNKDWVSIQWAERDNLTVFHAMGKNIVYLPVYYNKYQLTPCGQPFLLTKEGVVQSITADTTQRQTLKLIRKYPFFLKHWAKLTGAKFQGADTPDFSDSVTLYTIPEPPEMYFQDIIPSNPRPYRYYRFLSPLQSSLTVAELEFYSGENGSKRAIGRIIGSPGSYDDRPDRTADKAFDGDVLSFYHAKTWGTDWIGMDFGKPATITKIRYLPRNDDNNIAVGELYELFYWGDNGWVSLGQQTAGEQVLYYDNAPVKALFLLKNLTKGVEERIFTYKDNKQVWW